MSEHDTYHQGYEAACKRFEELVEQYGLPGPGASVEWNNGWRDAWEQIRRVVVRYL